MTLEIVKTEEEQIESLREKVETGSPEAEPLPKDPATRALIFEEGMALLMKESAKAMYGLRQENKMREDMPDGPKGEGWEFPFVLLAGFEAGFIAQQARGLVKLGKSEDVNKLLRTPQKRLISVWAAALEAAEEAFTDRDIGDDTNPLAISRVERFLGKTLHALDRSDKLFRQIANNRARRLGPKASMLARFHASSLHAKVRKRQQEAVESAMKGGHVDQAQVDEKEPGSEEPAEEASN